MKTSSSQIDLSLQESVEIKRKMMQEYEQYKDICNRAAKLYVGINQIYAMSVNVFMSLYVKSISLEKVSDTKFLEHNQSIFQMILIHFMTFSFQRNLINEVFLVKWSNPPIVCYVVHYQKMSTLH